MYTRDQMEEQLKQETKAALFEQQFATAFDKYLNEKRQNINQTYADKRDWTKYRLQPSYQEVRPFTVEGDDNKYRKAKWTSLLKDAAFYYDLPTIQEEREMRFKLQFRYDDLFTEAWRPPLQSRRDLVTWACESQN